MLHFDPLSVTERVQVVVGPVCMFVHTPFSEGEHVHRSGERESVAGRSIVARLSKPNQPPHFVVICHSYRLVFVLLKVEVTDTVQNVVAVKGLQE